MKFLLDFLHYLYMILTLTLLYSPMCPYESLSSYTSEKKRNINNNLAVLLSYDTISLLRFLVPRILQLII